ncbi:MAG: hypothetical protein WAO52_00950 [Prolixibacteraceae bacterium]
MKRFILILISFCALQFVHAQKEIIFDSIPKSPIGHENNEIGFEMPVMFDNSLNLDDLNLMDESLFHQPLLPDYNKMLDLKKYSAGTGLKTESFSNFGYAFSPYINAAVFNQASYKINDRLSFGGNSFGAQSVFETPKINPSIQDMSVKGASMFMQYKFSDNFKVETRVSISNRRSPWEP